jgi:hypothetical protein
MGNTKNLGLLAKNIIVSGSGNYVGVGTPTPTLPLEVSGSGRFTLGTGATIDMTTPGGATGIVYNTSAASNYSRFNTYNSPNSTSASRYFALEWDDNSAGIRILKSGNVGIGTTSPSDKLSVNGVISGISGVNVGANSLGTDRMFQISGTSFTSGTSQFGIVNNPTMSTPTTLYGYYGGVTVTSATNSYAMYLETTSGTVTNKYGIYQAGSGDKNYFAGNVGIGTSTFIYSPKLAINSVGQNSLAIQTTDSVQGTTGSVIYIGNGATTGNTYGVIRALTTGGTTIGNLVLQPDGSGNVGIGITSPGYNLDVEGYIAAKSGAYGGGGYVIKNYASGASRGWGIFNDQLVFGDLCINTSTTQTGSPNITRMYINASGNVGIATTSPGQPLDVAGNIRGTGLIVNNATGNQQLSFQKNASMRYALGTEIGSGTTNDFGIYNYIAGATAMTIYGNNNYQFFGSNVSDRRAKQDIQDLEFNATEKIVELKPKSYYMKNDPNQIRYGFIAQDVHEILPDLVCGDLEGEGFVGLDYNGILPILVGAIKEQQALIKELQDEMVLLKNK